VCLAFRNKAIIHHKTECDQLYKEKVNQESLLLVGREIHHHLLIYVNFNEFRLQEETVSHIGTISQSISNIFNETVNLTRFHSRTDAAQHKLEKGINILELEIVGKWFILRVYI
jgi:hypothetical protein